MTRVLHDLMHEAAAAVPDKVALYFKAETLTYAEVQTQALSLASALLNCGVQRRDRVAVFLEKRLEKVPSIFAISKAGAVFVPIRRLALGPQASHILSDSGCKALITTYGRLPLLAVHAAEFPELKTIVAIGKPEDAGRGNTSVTSGDFDFSAAFPGVTLLPWQAALAEKPVAYPRVVEPDLGAILYTSGSTGKPKGVVLSHLNLVAGAKTVAEYLQIRSDDRLLSILTFGFDYGLNQLTTCFLKQASLVLLDYLFPKDILGHIRKYECTGLAAVAATWLQLLQIPWSQTDTPTLRYITNSGGAIPEPYVRELRKRLTSARIFLMYGLTEAFRSTFLDPDLVDSHPTSIGKAIPGEEIMVLDPQGQPVPPGGTGELVHRGILVAQGYWNAPDLTAIRYRRNPLQNPAVPLPEMVVYSGDMVRIDAEGLMYFVGRNDEMIKSAGNRISPTEVEDGLYATGLIEAAVAMGMAHEIYGQTILAVVVPKAGSVFTAEALIQQCRATMPPYMVPARVETWEKIPQNANGKLDRSLVKQTVYAQLGVKDH